MRKEANNVRMMSLEGSIGKWRRGEWMEWGAIYVCVEVYLECGVVARLHSGVVLQKLVGEDMFIGVDLHQLLLRPLRGIRVRAARNVGHLACAARHSILPLHSLNCEQIGEAQEIRRHIPHFVQWCGDGFLHHPIPWRRNSYGHRCRHSNH